MKSYLIEQVKNGFVASLDSGDSRGYNAVEMERHVAGNVLELATLIFDLYSTEEEKIGRPLFLAAIATGLKASSLKKGELVVPKQNFEMSVEGPLPPDTLEKIVKEINQKGSNG